MTDLKAWDLKRSSSNPPLLASAGRGQRKKKIMAAKDYKICPALLNAYIAKVSKRNPNMMLDDRRIITDAEIFSLIIWRLRRFCIENEKSSIILTDSSGEIVEISAKGRLLEEITEEFESKREGEV